MGAVVKSVDHGYNAFVKQATEFRNPKIVVGILEKDASRADAEGVTVLDKAIWNEFGTDRIPPRSFLRAWFDGAQPEIRANVVKLVAAVAAGRISRDRALQQLGLWAQGQVQAKIASNIPPPNAPSTVRQKGSSGTLINHGQLRSAISYAVREEE